MGPGLCIAQLLKRITGAVEQECESVSKKRVFSGIQPSGDIHIGNYLGAIKNWVKLQDENECFFCVVDYHAITSPYKPEELRTRVFNACADLLACGIDPEKSQLFIQSMVPEHTELSWILSSQTSFGDLERMTQFKDKAQQQRKHVNAGLFSYPVLQTADISLYKAELVPVGEDQEQHLELAREIIRRFNGRFGELLLEPKSLITRGARIMGLNGESKMSKSKNNYAGIMEEPEEIWKKLAPAKTDENRKRLSDSGDPDKCNIFTLHRFFSTEQDQRWAAEGCRAAAMGCVDCKKRLMKGLEREFGPIRKRRQELEKEPECVINIIKRSAAACRGIASKTIQEVREAIGTGSIRQG